MLMIFRIRRMALFQRQLGQHLAERLVRIDCDLRQPGRTQRRTHVTAGAVLQWMSANIRQHLPPPGTSRTAADQRNAARLQAAGMQRIHAVRQCKTHPFQHGARQVFGPVLMRQPPESAFRLRIVMRRALTGEVGQEPQRRINQFGLLCQGKERRHIANIGQLAGPVQAGCGAQHDRHQVPGFRQRMAEAVHRTFRIAPEAVAHREINPRGAQRQHGLARLIQPDADRAGGIIATARHHR